MRIIKYKKIIWAGHVAFMEEKLNAYAVWLGKLKEDDGSEDVGVRRRIILKEEL